MHFSQWLAKTNKIDNTKNISTNYFANKAYCVTRGIMAKGLRSKSMRKNRSYLRKVLVEPMLRQRQEKIAQKLKANTESQQPKTLTALRNLISVAVPPGYKEQAESTAMDAEDDGEEEEEEEEEEQQAPQKKRGGGPNPDISKVVRGGRTIEVVASKNKATGKKK